MDKLAMEKVAFELGTKVAMEELIKTALHDPHMGDSILHYLKGLATDTQNLPGALRGVKHFAGAGMEEGFDDPVIREYLGKTLGQVGRGAVLPAAGLGAAGVGGYEALKPEDTMWDRLKGSLS